VRVAFVQFGDYADAERRFAAGGRETYYAQRFSVDYVAGLARRLEDVTVVCVGTDRLEERLPSGVRTLGIELYPPRGRSRHLGLLRALERLRPEALILMTPVASVLGWALLRRVRTLPMFFDSFHASGWKSRAHNALLARMLSMDSIEWVSNHNLAASLDLVRIGVDPKKVLPFDWPALANPADSSPKSAPPGEVFRLVYVGLLDDSKGVGDLLEALSMLRTRSGARWSLTLVGREVPELRERVARLGVGDAVEFRGLIPHDDVIPTMRAHDAVIVPSRHEYPEGLPLTIYEAFCSRSPVVVSNHGMFRFKTRDAVNALVFEAGNVAALAGALERLRTDGALYERLSRSGEDAARDFFCPLKYDVLISAWLSGPEGARSELARFSLENTEYGRTPLSVSER